MILLPKRNLLAGTLVVVGVGSYLLVQSAMSPALPPLVMAPPQLLSALDDWRAPLLNDWNAAQVTPLSQQDDIRLALVYLSRAASISEHMEDSPAKREALARCVADFLIAWSSPDADQYLNSINPDRIPVPHAADGQGVLGAFPVVTGRTLPLDMPSADVLQVFWRSRPDLLSRPTAIALTPPNAIIDFHQYNPDEGPRNCWRYRQWDEPTSDRWIGPVAAACVRLTQPAISMDEVRAVNGPWVDAAFVGLLVQLPDGSRFPMAIRCYWVPQTARWNISSISLITAHPAHWAY
ncbi:MAG: hypothetical protein KF841_12430 [Phycisphaerae bacterium]|nr:hypothetical protein [Phycisphaerae bacterium]